MSGVPEQIVEEQVWKLCKTNQVDMIKNMFFPKLSPSLDELKIQFQEFLAKHVNDISESSKGRLTSCIATIDLCNFWLKWKKQEQFDPRDVDYEELLPAIQESMKNPVLMTLLILSEICERFQTGSEVIWIVNGLVILIEKCFGKLLKFKSMGFSSVGPTRSDEENEAISLYKMAVAMRKVLMLKLMFRVSIINYENKTEESAEDMDLEKKQVDQLLKIGTSDGNEEFESECLDLPRRITDSSEAEKVARIITRNTNLMVNLFDESEYLDETKDKVDIVTKLFGNDLSFFSDFYKKERILFNQKYYSGLVYIFVAKFNTDDSMKYKMMVKALKNWDDFNIDSYNDPSTKTVYLAFLNQCYDFVWHYKYKMYMENRNEKCLKNLKMFARNRVIVGEQYLKHIKTSPNLHAKNYCEIHFAMYLCLRYILDDEEGADRYMKEICELLSVDPDQTGQAVERLFAIGESNYIKI